MTKDTFTTILAHVIAAVIVTAALWLLLSAVVSFVALDWRTATGTALGRWAFAVLWVWCQIMLFTPSKSK